MAFVSLQRIRYSACKNSIKLARRTLLVGVSNMSSDGSCGTFAEWTPTEARLEFRRNAFHGRSTSGWCLGSLQANVAILPYSLAGDFERFCELNKAPCPLLYRSERGEMAAGPLSDSSDIRTDVAKYCISEHGKVIGESTDLREYPWDDMVSFYIGCSFSFEEALVNAGLCQQLIKNDCNVPMFKTNIQCHPVGPFACPMVVSMRPVSKNLVEKVVQVTSYYDAVHGTPIHIGDPSIIGINDINSPHFGPNTCEIGEDEVPVFWACGVTSSLAVRSAKPSLSFSHSPGFMFICDTSVNEYFKMHPPEHGDAVAKLVVVKEQPFTASVLSDAAMRTVSQLESIMQQDLGGRGIGPLCIPGEMVKAAARLSRASSVAITTGFPNRLSKKTNKPVDENDGIPGAVAVAKALQALGKSVTIIACDYQYSVLQDVVKYCCDAGLLTDPVAILAYKAGTGDGETARKVLFPRGIKERPAFDMMVAIEAGSRNADGKYLTMKAIEVPILQECGVDELFIEAYKSEGIIDTVGIGDGGNEIGMGKVREQVVRHVLNGEQIASCVSTDFLLTAGVSNWGGYALAAALYVLHKCLVHSRFVRRGIGQHHSLELNQFVNTVEQERELLRFLVGLGLHDGITGQCEMSVDNLPFDPDHANMLSRLRQIASTE